MAGPGPLPNGHGQVCSISYADVAKGKTAPPPPEQRSSSHRDSLISASNTSEPERSTSEAPAEQEVQIWVGGNGSVERQSSRSPSRMPTRELGLGVFMKKRRSRATATPEPESATPEPPTPGPAAVDLDGTSPEAPVPAADPDADTPEQRAARLNDLKSFAANFKLNTPVPSGLLPILARDREKQLEIKKKAEQGSGLKKERRKRTKRKGEEHKRSVAVSSAQACITGKAEESRIAIRERYSRSSTLAGPEQGGQGRLSFSGTRTNLQALLGADAHSYAFAAPRSLPGSPRPSESFSKPHGQGLAADGTAPPPPSPALVGSRPGTPVEIGIGVAAPESESQGPAAAPGGIAPPIQRPEAEVRAHVPATDGAASSIPAGPSAAAPTLQSLAHLCPAIPPDQNQTPLLPHGMPSEPSRNLSRSRERIRQRCRQWRNSRGGRACGRFFMRQVQEDYEQELRRG
jgi:hypothetical protein